MEVWTDNERGREWESECVGRKQGDTDLHVHLHSKAVVANGNR